MALKEDGSLVVWALSGGTGYPTALTNVPAEARTGVKAIAAGAYHALALKTNGTVISWGYTLAAITSGLSNVTAIAAGMDENMALKDDGSIVVWRESYQRPIPEEARSGAIAIAKGYPHSIALKQDGTIVQWAANGVASLSNVPPSAMEGVRAISATYLRSVVVKHDGSVVSWGNGYYGPQSPPTDTQSGVIAVSTRAEQGFPHDYTLALKDDGTVLHWGNLWGASNSPSASEGNGRFRAVAAGGESALLLYEPKLPVVAPFTFRYWTGPTGPVVSIDSSASLDSLAPFATAQWHLNGRPLEGVPTTNLFFSGHQATLRIPIINTNQSGIYTIVYSNDAGSVTSAPLAEIDVREPWITRISLEITRHADASRIAWHTNAWDLMLQSTTNLNPPVTWTDWAETPSVIGSQFVVTNRPASPHQFFRLFRPFD